jgi:phosphopantothenoylcysteine decarboxylase
VTPPPSESLLDGVETARVVIIANAKSGFDDVRTELTERLQAARAEDKSFFEIVYAAAATLSASLSEEKIQTTFKRDGKRVTEIIDIGKRVTKFKDLLSREEAKLADYWKQWEDLQDEYVDIGIEVFGPEVFREEAGQGARNVGFKWEIELLDREHVVRIEEFEEEIVGLGAKTRQKIKASEKVPNHTLTC